MAQWSRESGVGNTLLMIQRSWVRTLVESNPGMCSLSKSTLNNYI